MLPQYKPLPRYPGVSNAGLRLNQYGMQEAKVTVRKSEFLAGLSNDHSLKLYLVSVKAIIGPTIVSRRVVWESPPMNPFQTDVRVPEHIYLYGVESKEMLGIMLGTQVPQKVPGCTHCLLGYNAPFFKSQALSNRYRS